MKRKEVINMMIKLLGRTIYIFAMLIFTSMGFSITANANTIDNNTVQYTVSEGVVYWESEQWGIGRHNTVSKENRYTNTSCGELSILIDGYAVVDQNGVVETYFNEKVQKLNIPAITSEQELMVHIWEKDEGGYRLGWIKFSEVNCKEDKSDYSEIPEEDEEEWFENSKEKTVEDTVDTLRRAVEEDAKIPRESYIFADFSGSMRDYHLDVLKKLEDTSGKKYVFAEDVKKFVPGKDKWAYNIGASTDIANALNTVNVRNDSHIYLLTDLQDNCGGVCESNEKFVGEITIVYYPGYYSNAMDFMERMKEAYPNATITGF